MPGSFYVLHLLPQFLDLGLGRHHRLGDGNVLGLGGDGVDLPVHLLDDEVQLAPRPGEVDGVHYYFISQEQFLRRRAEGDFLECAQINGGYWYGTPRGAVLEKLEQGQSVLLEIENNGAQQVIKRYPQTVSVFILPPDRMTLIQRLVDRGTEDLERLEKRIGKVPSELEAAKGYTCLVVNDQVAHATARLAQIFDGDLTVLPRERETLDRLVQEFADPQRSLALLRDYYQKSRMDFELEVRR